MDSTFLINKELIAEDTAEIDEGIKKISENVSGITLMLYTSPVVVICHTKENLSDDQKENINIFLDSYIPVKL